MYRRTLPAPQLAREASAAWNSTPDLPKGTGEDQDADRVVAQLSRWAKRTADLDLDTLADPDLERVLDALRIPIARLEAARAHGLAAMERRAARRAPTGGATAAELEQRRRNAQRQRMAPSQAKQAAEAGRAATDHPATGAAFRAGTLGPDHAQLIGSLLRRVPLDRQAALEPQLLDLAADLDPVAFGRRARALVATHEPEAARRDEQLKHERRSVRASDTPDGGFSFAGLLHGTAAETARTAVKAFRRPDTPDEHRTTEQRNADAFEQLCESALRSGEAPTDHGMRPHVIIVVDEADLTAPNGLVRLAHSSQPATTRTVGHLLDDCVISRIVRDTAGTPIEASAEVRTVPKGLWRALLVRDSGCTWPGCDAPASWCDVAHGNVAFRNDGRLAPDNAALLCRRHHRRFDTGQYRMLITGNQVHYEHRPPTGNTPEAFGREPSPHEDEPAPTVGTPAPTRDEMAPARDEAAPPGREPAPPGREPAPTRRDPGLGRGPTKPTASTPPRPPGGTPAADTGRTPNTDPDPTDGTPTLFDPASGPDGNDPP